MPAPSPRFLATPCSRCGATMESEAETKCTPSFDIGGDAYCPGSATPALPDGTLTDLDPAYIAALDLWIGQQVAATDLTCLSCGKEVAESNIAHFYDDGILGTCCKMTAEKWEREKREIATAAESL